MVYGFRLDFLDLPFTFKFRIDLLHPTPSVTRLGDFTHWIAIVPTFFSSAMAGQLMPLHHDLLIGDRLEVRDAQKMLCCERLDA